VSLDEILDISKSMGNEGESYRHSEYQSMITASALSLDKMFKILVVPTGSGKTWI